nr:rho-associated protein kinase 2-like isoform X3 [Megalopta genalis]
MVDIILCWICWLFWVGLPTLTAYPISSSIQTDLSYIHITSGWERYWIQCMIAVLSITAAAFTLVGCLCCRRPRRPKGFQEFKDGNNIGPESALEHTIEGLELDVPRMLTIADRVQFEPLPVDHIISGSKNSSKLKPLPLSTSFFEERDSDPNTLPEHCRDWFDAQELSVPREKLKYLRELGHGWFGKVVEGRADLEECKRISKNGGVVVRILTEEATTKEKAWFLGEATPYLKLQHQNILTLLGLCLDTDPYLLIFESCPVGDLKRFLLSNYDLKSQNALIKENIPIRMALDIAAGLKHMHDYGFVHTDLSARNCLVASDLSAKLGDYGTGVEKYPEDYYVVGDRALPIRWSAPESIECTDTTIETREITPQANMWSYGIFLWEIATWGSKPYNDKSDEQVIQMLLSLRTDSLPNGTQVLQTYLEGCASNILQAIQLCLDSKPQKRSTLDEVKQILLNEYTDYLDFDQRWESLRVNKIKHIRSASLQDLRGSIDSDYWTTIVDDTPRQSSFRLGPCEPVKNVPNVKNIVVHHESSSETEEESWKRQIEQGVYTEKVKEKSKSVTDLMVLVHIDLDSDAEVSMGTQVPDKYVKKKLPASGSDSDIRHSVHTDEFDEALRKLRDSLPNNTSHKIKMLDTSERPKLLTLTMDQGQTPILRLSLDDDESVTENSATPTANANVETRSDKHVLRLLSKGNPDLPLLRFVPDVASSCETLQENIESQYNDVSKHENNDNSYFSNNFSVNYEELENQIVDVELWNHALDSVLKKKVPGFLYEGEFNQYTEPSTKQVSNDTPELIVTAVSTENTPQCQTKYSTYNTSDEFSNVDDIDMERQCIPNDEEEERKQLSTPDDEQSSDSGFRDKESCEEEENVCSSSVPASSVNDSAMNTSTCTEEQQLQILFELDAILDAEYYATLQGPEKVTESLSLVKCTGDRMFQVNDEESDSLKTVDTIVEIEVGGAVNVNSTENNTVISVSEGEKEVEADIVCKREEHVEVRNSNNISVTSPLKDAIQNHRVADLQNHSVSMDMECMNTHRTLEEYLPNVNKIENETEKSESANEIEKFEIENESKNENSTETKSENRNKTENEIENRSEAENEIENKSETENESENRNEDENKYQNQNANTNDEEEDSSTMSLRSDNSYVSFGMEEEFVTAIRNELREKLPCAQMSVVEPLEMHDDDDNPSLSTDIENKQWDDDDEDNEEMSNQGSGGVGISIRYNIYGTPLSPIQEERESTLTSESLMSNSRDTSITSRESAVSDDVLLVDTRTNKMVLLEGLGERLHDDERDTTNGDLSEEENLDYNCSVVRSRDEKSHIMIGSGVAPLPSPEEESKWQQLPPPFPLPLPLPVEDGLMSTSFGTEHGWGSQDEDEEEEEEEEDEEDEDEDNSSSSGEFVWKRYNEPHVEQVQTRSMLASNSEGSAVDIEDEMDAEEEEEDEEEEEEEEEDEEEEEFTPSAWNATLAPHRSALRSPDKTLKSGDDSDQKKSVWFKKQRYHCVYEYPKETLATDTQGETSTTWEPTSYAGSVSNKHISLEYCSSSALSLNWEEMLDEPRLDLYPLDYDDGNHTGNEEFFVSSSNRPFQFQTSDSKYVSQFFPGASTSANEESDEVDSGHQVVQQNRMELMSDYGHSQQHQLGELRHTRDRLKLNLSTNGTPSFLVKQLKEDDIEQLEEKDKVVETAENVDFTENQCILSNSSNHDLLPMVPLRDIRQERSLDPASSKSVQCDSQRNVEPTDKCSVLIDD